MYKKWRLNRALSYMSFLFTSGLKKIVSHEGALNSRPGTDVQVDEGLSSVFRVSVKTAYVLHSLTQGVLGPQLGGVFFFFFFFSSRFSFYFLPIENQIFFFFFFFFFFHSLRAKIFFSGQSQNKLFFFLNSIYARNVFFQIYPIVYFLNPIYMGIIYMGILFICSYWVRGCRYILKLILISTI